MNAPTIQRFQLTDTTTLIVAKHAFALQDTDGVVSVVSLEQPRWSASLRLDENVFLATEQCNCPATSLEALNVRVIRGGYAGLQEAILLGTDGATILVGNIPTLHTVITQ